MEPKPRVDPVYEYVDNKVTSLKKRLTQLKNRVETLELGAFQEQITYLSSQVDGLGNGFMQLHRDKCCLEVRLNLLWALWVLTPQQANQVASFNARLCIQYAREQYMGTLAAIAKSNNPNQDVNDWYSRCAQFFRQHGNPDLFV